MANQFSNEENKSFNIEMSNSEYWKNLFNDHPAEGPDVVNHEQGEDWKNLLNDHPAEGPDVVHVNHEQEVAQNMPDDTNLSSANIRSKQAATHQAESSTAAAKKIVAAAKKRNYREVIREKKETNDKAMKELQTKCQSLEEKCKELEEKNKELQATSKRLNEDIAKATATEKSTKKKYKTLKCKQRRQQDVLADLALKLVNNPNKNVEDGTEEILIRRLVDAARKRPKFQNLLENFKKEIDAKAKDVAEHIVQGLFKKDSII